MVRHWALLVLPITLLGCSPKRSRPVRKIDTSENQAMLNKLQGYTRCLEHSNRIFQIADRYRERFAAMPPTVDASAPTLVSEDPEYCLKALNEAKGMEPDLPELDAAAERYSRALLDVFHFTTTARDLFDRTSPSFAPAKGVELHPRLLAAFDAFDSTQSVLFDQVYQLNHKAHAAQVAAREERDGRTLAVVTEEMMLRAEDLVQFAGRAWTQIDKIDTEAITLRLRQFESTFDEFEGMVLGMPQPQDVSKGYWATKAPANAYVMATRQLLLRIRDNVAFSEADQIMLAAKNEESVVGTPEAVVNAYNRLVDSSFMLVVR